MKKVSTLLLATLLSLGWVFAQNPIQGKITDETGYGLPGVNIKIKEKNTGTTTDIEGVFKLEGVSGDDVLLISFIGYKPIEVLVGSRTNFDFRLEPDMTSLDEVIIIGYGAQKKSIASTAISKVGGDALEKMNLPNVGRNLQGLAAGVSVSGASGQPGSNPTILIRGAGTNGDNRPLIVIDGLQDGDLSTLAPADIESIEILKDAASTAIYGTKGANGVIFVTTKKGSAGQTRITYDGSYLLQSPWRIPEMMNAEQYVDLMNEKYQAAGVNLPVGFPRVGDPLPVNTNWMGALFEPAKMQHHHVAISRNNENGSVFSSVSYLNQEGVIAPEKSFFERFTARLNSTTKINNYLNFGQNLTLVNTRSSSIPENNEFSSPLADALLYDPITPIFDPNAQFGFAQSPFVQQEYVNPFSRIFINNNTASTQNVFGNMYLELKPVDFIRVRSDFGANYFNSTNDTYVPAYDLTPAFFLNSSAVSHNAYSNFRWQWENYISVSKSIQDHSFEFVLGSTAIQFNQKFFGASGQELPEEALFNENLRFVDATPDSTRRSYGREAVTVSNTSLFTRVIYNYKEKYLFTGSVRRDGSSKFGPNNRFGIFPAVSGGWVLSAEDFWDVPMVDFLKLRASWGVNGNDRIPDLTFSSLIAPNIFTYPFGPGGNQTVYYGGAPVALSNPLLGWEESRQLDIGLETRIFKNRVGLELDYYRKVTSGLLIVNQSIPIIAGNNPSFSNIGEVLNSGFEFKIDFGGNFRKVDYSVSLNGTTLNNVVTQVDGNLGFVNGYNWPVRNAFITRMETDRPLFYFRGYQTNGIFQSQEDVFRHVNSNGDLLQPNARPGDIRFVDTNGDGRIDLNDWTEIGKPWADFIFGANFNLNYKAFDLSMLVSGQLGNQVYRTFERQDIPNRNYLASWVDRWSPNNPTGTLPRVALGASNPIANNNSPSDFFVEDASFARIRNLQIGYSLPNKVLEKAKIAKARIYLSGDNLLTLTKYSGFDPEIGVPNYNVFAAGIDRGFYPQLRSYGGGVQLTF